MTIDYRIIASTVLAWIEFGHWRLRAKRLDKEKAVAYLDYLRQVIYIDKYCLPEENKAKELLDAIIHELIHFAYPRILRHSNQEEEKKVIKYTSQILQDEEWSKILLEAILIHMHLPKWAYTLLNKELDSPS